MPIYDNIYIKSQMLNFKIQIKQPLHLDIPMFQLQQWLKALNLFVVKLEIWSQYVL
jgi:hypothetical protein